jgi:hypothetical protein
MCIFEWTHSHRRLFQIECQLVSEKSMLQEGMLTVSVGCKQLQGLIKIFIGSNLSNYK